MTEQSGRSLLNSVSEAAAESPDFRRALVEDPKAALAKAGMQLPDGLEVKVVEEAANVCYVVLPYSPEQLSDEELDQVAGGGDCYGVHDVSCDSLCVKKWF